MTDYIKSWSYFLLNLAVQIYVRNRRFYFENVSRKLQRDRNERARISPRKRIEPYCCNTTNDNCETKTPEDRGQVLEVPSVVDDQHFCQLMCLNCCFVMMCGPLPKRLREETM